MSQDPQVLEFQVVPADYTADFDALRLVRETVFVQEQQVPLDEEWDDLDPQCEHVLAVDLDHRPIGTGRLTPGRKIGRMAVMKDWRGRGVGEAILLALIERARARGWDEVSLHAQVSAEGFYSRAGFSPEGERFMEAGIEHITMRRALDPLPAARGPWRPAVATLAAGARDRIAGRSRGCDGRGHRDRPAQHGGLQPRWRPAAAGASPGHRRAPRGPDRPSRRDAAGDPAATRGAGCVAPADRPRPAPGQPDRTAQPDRPGGSPRTRRLDRRRARWIRVPAAGEPLLRRGQPDGPGPGPPAHRRLRPGVRALRALHPVPRPRAVNRAQRGA
ncbi:GNAT family N-acetyltransferase [Alkalisalibacterium limincola]|uniref:GNAT family N-acetyltransferase n=1 Tax=Alkalisalibacterium limincola TaxID=2699169 RepID=A0A5C8KGZ1_9GAMM|nr:GNAT family N-acetyltransferase [Alkalisalibacterium limincola]